VYLGADEVIGRVALAGRRRLEPGEEADAQIRLERATVTDADDPIVIRRYSPMGTLGGGTVLNAHPPVRRRGETLTAARTGLDERLEDAVAASGPAGAAAEDLMASASATRAQVEQVVGRLEASGRIISIRGRVFHADVGQRIADAIRREVAAYHQAVPWRPGIPREELKTKIFPSGDARFYAAVLQRLSDEGVVAGADFIRLPGFTPRLSEAEAAARERIAAALLRGGFSPPGRAELASGVEPESFERLFRSLLDDGTVVEVGQGVCFHRDALDEIKRIVAELVAVHGSVTVASLRDRLQASRKYALTVLEHFDTIKLTRRVGDARVLLDRSKLPASPT
jgi:selenocysteine-specific elongation factor